MRRDDRRPTTDDGPPTTDHRPPTALPPVAAGRPSSVVGGPSSVFGPPLRILQVVTSSIGGAAEHVLSLTGGLQARGHDCTLAFAPGEPLDGAFAATGARLVHLRMRRTVDLPALAADTAALYQLMRRER